MKIQRITSRFAMYKKFIDGKNKIINIKGELFMDNNMLTTKEATLISDLLTMEESACKKARLYARTLTNEKLAQKFNKIADNHEMRFNALFELL